jgi:hypothetical protein
LANRLLTENLKYIKEIAYGEYIIPFVGYTSCRQIYDFIARFCGWVMGIEPNARLVDYPITGWFDSAARREGGVSVSKPEDGFPACAAGI